MRLSVDRGGRTADSGDQVRADRCDYAIQRLSAAVEEIPELRGGDSRWLLRPREGVHNN